MVTGRQDSDGFPGTIATKASPTTSDIVEISDAADSGNLKKSTVNSLPFVQLAGSTMTGALVLSGDPVVALGAATKQYVDAIAAGIDIKTPAYAATTAALNTIYANGAAGVGATLTNNGALAAFSVDGVSPPINSRILVKNQASTFENGIYTLTTVGSGAVAWVLTRATDYDEPAEITIGSLVIVQNGTVNAITSWLQTEAVVAIGVDPILFTQFSAISAPLDATYITQTPNGSLTNEQALSALATGIMKSTTATGVVSIAAAGTDYVAPATTITIAGTPNEIASSAGAQDLSANRTWTLSLPAALTFTGKTVTGGTFDGGSGTNFTHTTGSLGTAVTAVTQAVANNSTLVSTTAYVDRYTGGILNNSFAQGRLTLTTATAVTTSDVNAAGTLYFTPYKGNLIALYTAAAWKLYTFTERSIAVPGGTNQMYDIFLYDNAGTLTLEAVAWTNDTTRATAITLQDGVYCKSGALDRRYLGSIRTRTASQCTDSVLFRHCWNYYNRVPANMVVTDSTDSWNYTTATFRQANANAANQLDLVIGISEDIVEATAIALYINSGIGVACTPGIGVDVTNASSATLHLGPPNLSTVNGTMGQCFYQGYPGVGRHILTWLEYSIASGTTTWYGDAGFPVSFQCGLQATVFR